MLTTHEARVHWRTIDAPHAAEDIDAGFTAPLNGTFPRMLNLYCCGFLWEDRADLDAHKDCCHR